MISQKLRYAIVVLRDHCICLRCGREISTPDYSIHHRRSRGMGGSRDSDSKSNLVTLCGSGTTGCHGWITEHPAEAYESGWMVRRNSRDIPEEIRLVDLRGRMFFLDDLGGVTYVTKGVAS